MALVPSWPRRAILSSSLAACMTISACGGGGGGGSAPPATPPTGGGGTTATAVHYPRSVALGSAPAIDLAYTPAVGATQASVLSAQPTTLLALGTTSLTAVHADAAWPGVVVACVSGAGSTTNVVTGINLGVDGRSAAVLLDATWAAVDAAAAWQAASARSQAWLGWENCGLKPEGLPSPSSRLSSQPDGSYAEIVYDGNPGTTFNTLNESASAGQVSAMLSSAGFLTTADPTRPLRLTLRAYANAAGAVLWIEDGEPAPGAPASTAGFVALYLAAPT